MDSILLRWSIKWLNGFSTMYWVYHLHRSDQTEGFALNFDRHFGGSARVGNIYVYCPEQVFLRCKQTF